MSIIRLYSNDFNSDAVRSRKYIYKCLCECGNTCLANSKYLMSGEKKSCGCLKKERLALRNKTTPTRGNLSHGQALKKNKSKTYNSWVAMKNRCNNKKATDYKYYGGRGIKIIKRWIIFSAFYKDMGERPIGCTLDRINNEGNYELKNCRWATHKEQMNNTRRSNAYNKRKSI